MATSSWLLTQVLRFVLTVAELTRTPSRYTRTRAPSQTTAMW